MTARLELRSIRKSYAGKAAVDDVNLVLRPGEFVSLLGPSGCGKSTTLAMVAGFDVPDGGEIFIEGRRVDAVPPGRRGVGIVFQDYGVFTRLTVRQNLAFGLEARGEGKSARDAAVIDMAGRLGLAALLERKGASLNTSELQRVAIGRALVTRPGLLLLDEPLANLDASLRERLRGELRHIQRSLGQTVLNVTHDQVEALAVSDRVAVMNEGRVVQIGTPREIYDRPRNLFVAQFIGDPPINLLPCTVQADVPGVLLRTGAHRNLGAGVAATPGNYLLGLRPHRIAVSREPIGGSVPGTVRHVENLGPEHVLHVEHGHEILRALARPGTANAGEIVHLRFDLRDALLIEPGSGHIYPPAAALEEAA